MLQFCPSVCIEDLCPTVAGQTKQTISRYWIYRSYSRCKGVPKLTETCSKHHKGRSKWQEFWCVCLHNFKNYEKKLPMTSNKHVPLKRKRPSTSWRYTNCEWSTKVNATRPNHKNPKTFDAFPSSLIHAVPSCKSDGGFHFLCDRYHGVFMRITDFPSKCAGTNWWKMTKSIGGFCIVKRESAVFICCYLVLICFSGTYFYSLQNAQY